MKRDRPALQAQDFSVGFGVGATAGEVVEGAVGDANDVVADEGRAFRSTCLRMLDTALPLKHGPSRIVVLCHLGEDLFEVDLAVAQRAEAAGAIDPTLIAAVDTGASAWMEFGVLDVERAYTVVIDVEEGEVI